ncbi:MAG: hypothetical protein J7J82_00705 [Staphylothermus sp.]|nr:hypothetical protein [Staphylothermus sp.]
MKRIFIATEDTYAKNALKILIKELFGKHILQRTEIHSLSPCSSKMTRILRAALLDDDIGMVIVLVDAETNNPKQVTENIYHKHLRTEHDKAHVIALNPCIEEWPCTILGLKNCNTAPCVMGPARSIDEYWMKKHGQKYRKSLLPDIFKEMLQYVKERTINKPNTLKKFIEILYTVL